MSNITIQAKTKNRATPKPEELSSLNRRLEVVNTGTGDSVSYDREQGANATQQTSDWTEAEDITRIVVTSIGGDSVICFDAPDTATAATWLAGNVAQSAATMRKVVKAGTPREFLFTNPLRRVDSLQLIATVTNVFIEAGK